MAAVIQKDKNYGALGLYEILIELLKLLNANEIAKLTMIFNHIGQEKFSENGFNQHSCLYQRNVSRGHVLIFI